MFARPLAAKKSRSDPRPNSPATFSSQFVARIPAVELFRRSVGNQAMLRLLSPQARGTTVDRIGQRTLTAATSLKGTNLPREDSQSAQVKVNGPPESKPAKKTEPQKPPEKKTTPPSESTCDRPVSMTAVRSGSFLDGLTMDDYYPDLKGKGYYASPGTAGPFDTGSRCGSNVQLVASISAPCHDDVFQFTQTVHHDKSIFNGAKDSDDGTTHDDIADSGRDYGKAPARHVVGSDGGKLLHVSMADPPSLLYARAPNVEWDRSFVTALVGSKGKAEVSWHSSIVVKDGKVLKNTVT